MHGSINKSVQRRNVFQRMKMEMWKKTKTIQIFPRFAAEVGGGFAKAFYFVSFGSLHDSVTFFHDVSHNASPALLLIMPSLPPIYLHHQCFLVENLILKLKQKGKRECGVRKICGMTRRKTKVPFNSICQTMWNMHVRALLLSAHCWFAVATFGFIFFGSKSVLSRRVCSHHVLYHKPVAAHKLLRCMVLAAPIPPQSTDMR